MKQIYNRVFFKKKASQKFLKNVVTAMTVFLTSITLSAQVWTINVCSNTPSTTQSNVYGPMYSVATANATNRLTTIYPSAQLSAIASQTLTSIYFHTGAGNATGMLGTPNLKVYLKEVSNSDWGSGALDWATASTGATLVFDGNPAPLIGSGGGWKQFPLTTSFNYSGNQNLAVFLEYKNPTASNAITWSYEYTTPCTSVSATNFETKYSNNTTGTLPTSLASTNSRRPYIGFDHPVLCPAPTNVTTTGVTQNAASINWTAGGTETSWDYAIQPAGTGVPVTFVNSTTNTLNPTTLNSNTNYEFFVRAVCGGTNGNSIWKGPYLFKTLCGPMTSMFENFDSYATGNIVPDCWARIIGGSNTAQTISSTGPASGNRNLYQVTSTAANATVVVMPEFSNVNAGTHWLRFKARVASATGSLDVGYVTSATDASTFVNIQTINILNSTYTSQDSEYSVIVPTTVPANARLAIRNNGVSTVGHFYDDVYWEAKPSCMSPTNITVSNVTPTTAQIQWTASVTPPASGYDIYYSTTDTPPTSSTAPSATVASGLSSVVGPLSPMTKYYVWVRSRCSGTDFSAWSNQIVTFSTPCQPPDVLSTAGATVCPGNTATLSATTSSGASLTWYDASTAGNVVGTGPSFTTPTLTSTTPYYVSASLPSVVGAALPDAISDTGYTLEAGLIFDAVSNFTINGVNVYPIGTGAGTVTIALQQINGTTATTLQSITVNLTGTAAPYVKTYVPLNFAVTQGTNYKLMMLSRTGGVASLIRESGSSWGSYPLNVPGKFSITNGNCCSGNTTSTSYYYFYDWQISSVCESPRTMVTASVDCLSTSEIDKKDNIKVYPNPFSEVVNITKPELVKSIKVSDASGKLIKTFSQPESLLRLNDLSQGMYILQLEMKDGSRQSVKIIKK